MNYKVITDENNLSGKKVLLRLDLNIPLGEVIEGHIRLTKALEMINYLRLQGAKILIISHIGRDPEETLKPLVAFFENYFKITFIENIFNSNLEKIVDDLRNGDVLFFENIRKWKEEKENGDDFARHIASLADIYVNEAFAVSHRDHASIVGIPKYLPSYAGIQLDKEIKNLSKVFNCSHPFVSIIGGVKFETKIPLIKKFIRIADNIVVVGALANDIYRYHGHHTEGSLVSDTNKDDIKSIALSDKVIVPKNVLVLRGLRSYNKKIDKVMPDEKIVDSGKGTMKQLKKIVLNAKTVVWNGPFGMYEQGYIKGTKKFAKLLSKNKGLTIVGGGDTLASIKDLGLEDKFDFVSTGGGAMLEFLERETLTGIEALNDRI